VLNYVNLNEWQSFVEGHPNRMIFHDQRWIVVLVSQYGFRLQIPTAKEGGEIVAGIPFLETTSIFGRKKLISLPFTDTIRVLTRERSQSERLRKAIIDEISNSYSAVVIRTDERLNGNVSNSEWVCHDLRTDQPFGAIETTLPSGLKRNLRKATRSDLKFERKNDTNAMEDFYRLHLMTRRKLGIPIQPRSFFRHVQQQIIEPRLGFVGMVYQHGEPIAAGVFFVYNKTMTYKYGASHPRALAERPNDFLFHNVIRIACDEGYHHFDFGISKVREEGLRRFKQKWGAREIQVHDDYLSGTGRLANDDSTSLKIASVVIRNTPSIVCRAVGEAFYRYSQ